MRDWPARPETIAAARAMVLERSPGRLDRRRSDADGAEDGVPEQSGPDDPGTGGSHRAPHPGRRMALLIAICATAGVALGAVCGATDSVAALIAWAVLLFGGLGVGTWRILRARSSRPDPTAELRVKDRDRVRIAATRAAAVPALPAGLQPVAVEAARRADLLRSAGAPWIAAAAGSYLGGTLGRAVVEPGVSSGLNLALGLVVVAGQWIHVVQWRQARRVIAAAN